MKTTHHAHQGRNQKRSVRGARVKKIKCPGKKKYHFLLHELYFSANQGGARALAGTYLGAATDAHRDK
jgi:N-formylglutamate amidohydrolase